MSGTLEARVHDAARTLSMLAGAQRATLERSALGPRRPAPAWRSFAGDARAALGLDPAAAALLAEAWVGAASSPHLAQLDQVVRARPAVLRGEVEAIPLSASRANVSATRDAPRRRAVMAAATERAGALRDDARAAVDSLRRAFEALDPALVDVLAPRCDDADAVIDATEDLWVELDRRVLRGLDLDPARMSWPDRLRSFVGASLLREVPPATWSAIGVQWWDRAGLGALLGRVVDRVGASSSMAEGVYALIDVEAGRATLAGRPAPSAWDAAELLGVASRGVGAVIARGQWSAHRRGADRVADGALHALGRRLLHERTFLSRVAQLDPAPAERVRVEALHAELARVRWDAVMARFARDALARAPALTARLHDGLTRAWGCAPPTAWAPHLAASMLAAGGPWGGCWGVAALGARVEVGLRDSLRERFDEDWHRNPRAGEWLRVTLDALRAAGVGAWLEEHPAPPEALALRLTRDYERR